MKIRKIFSYTALCLLVAQMTACSGSKNESTETEQTVKLDTVRAEGEGRVLQYPGRLVPAQEANISFKVAGTLKRVCVDEGDHVAAGQLLAEIDPVDYEVQLKATEAEYAQVKAEAERVMGLYADGGTTASNNDKARYGLQQMEAKLEHHRHQVAYTKLYAPFGGTVQKRYFEGRETVGAGMPVLSILSGGELEVEVNLPAQSYMQKEGFSSYSCTLDIAPGKNFPLKLAGILPKANANQLYTMRLRFQEKDASLAPGMSAWVTIGSAGEGNRMLRVPTTAIMEEGGKSYVFVYDGKSHRVHRSAVEVASLHTDGSAVVEGSLSEGDLVVCTGVHHLKDGGKVKLLAPVSKTNVGGLL